MEVQESGALVPRRLPAAPVAIATPEELLANWQRADAERRRQQTLGGCPPDLAAFAAGTCALVYHPWADVRHRLAAEEATSVAAFDLAGSQAVAFERRGVNWIVFRGSESSPETELFLDWGHDVLSVPWGWPPRHLGFASAWNKIRGPVLAWIAARSNGGRVVLSGHSLGGALALAAAHDVAIAQLAPIEAVITFGSPRIGTWPWTARYHRLTAKPAGDGLQTSSLREVTWRVHNEGDIVTYVPPVLFAHCGRPVSASQLQAGAPNPFAWAPADVPAAGVVARLKAGYRGAKRVLPYSPVNLLVDLMLAAVETAPQHFMRHYGPAFPARPFLDLGEPGEMPGPKSGVNTALRFLRGTLVAVLGGSLLWIGWQAYRLSPEVTGALLLATLLYSLLEYVPAPAGSVALRPSPSVVHRVKK